MSEKIAQRLQAFSDTAAAYAMQQMLESIFGRFKSSTLSTAGLVIKAGAKFNVFVFTVNAAGATFVQMGVEGSTEAQIRWPKSDPKKAILGMIIVNPAGTGNFVGGTTALDDATVMGAGGVTYISPVGSFDPNPL
jgi:hypothetical protein